MDKRKVKKKLILWRWFFVPHAYLTSWRQPDDWLKQAIGNRLRLPWESRSLLSRNSQWHFHKDHHDRDLIMTMSFLLVPFNHLRQARICHDPQYCRRRNLGRFKSKILPEEVMQGLPAEHSCGKTKGFASAMLPETPWAPILGPRKKAALFFHCFSDDCQKNGRGPSRYKFRRCISIISQHQLFS